MAIRRDDLIQYFQRGAKPVSEHKLGMEYEIFGLVEKFKWTLPYHGIPGVQAILKEIAAKHGWISFSENKNIISLKKGDRAIFLEPGGQIELSTSPFHLLRDLSEELTDTIRTLNQASRESGIHWMALGIHPFASLEDIPWVPKGRYKIMSEYFAEKGGRLSHLMMKQTASIQLNVDYENEKDAFFKFRLLTGLAPVFTAIFANSSVYNGTVSPYLSYRAYVWQHTDPQRCGLIADLFEPGFSFEAFIDYALSVPMLFIKRDEKWLSVKNLNFKKFMKDGYEENEATLEDWALHLSTIFTEVRLKQFIELRSIDSQLPGMAMGAAALLNGILYSRSGSEAAWDLIRDRTWEERLRLYEDVPKYGLRTLLNNVKIITIARELTRIAENGLTRKERELGVAGEKELLSPVTELLKGEETLAEKSREAFKASPQDWIESNELGTNDEKRSG